MHCLLSHMEVNPEASHIWLSQHTLHKLLDSDKQKGTMCPSGREI